MGITSCAVTLFLLSNMLWSGFSSAADVFIDFGDPNWDSEIERSSDEENRRVVTDPTTGQGHVLRVDYEPSTMKGTQFDYPAFSQAADPDEACLYYEVFFENDFEFVKGGKLPGLYGGPGICSGGRHDNCFSTRLMWRTDGKGEVYVYMTTDAGEESRPILCEETGAEPEIENHCNAEFGWSYQRGAVSFHLDTWNTVSQRVRMNTVGEADGELEVKVNGEPISAYGLTWRTKGDDITIRGLFFSTFFGGSDSSWAPSKDVTTYFRNINFGGCRNVQKEGSD